MRNLAIIPARSGSKRIPNKNIKDFLGKPIISYTIKSAVSSNIFDEVMVSTDDKNIADISEQYGAVVPFYRSKETSNDFAIIADVVTEVLTNYKMQGKTFDNICILFATAPLITVARITESYKMLINDGFDSVLPVLKFSYPIQRALQIENKKLSFIEPENYAKRSQDLMPTYHDSGQFYWIKTSEFENQKTLFTKNAGAIILSETEAQDIDTEEDWKIAEIKYKLLNQ